MSNPIVNGMKAWVGFSPGANNPILSTNSEDDGSVEPPPPPMFFLATESGDPILTESNVNIQVEHI